MCHGNGFFCFVHARTPLSHFSRKHGSFDIDRLALVTNTIAITASKPTRSKSGDARPCRSHAAQKHNAVGPPKIQLVRSCRYRFVRSLSSDNRPLRWRPITRKDRWKSISMTLTPIVRLLPGRFAVLSVLSVNSCCSAVVCRAGAKLCFLGGEKRKFQIFPIRADTRPDVRFRLVNVSGRTLGRGHGKRVLLL